MLKKLMRLNWDDYLAATLIPTGVFLLIQIVTGIVLAVVEPGSPDVESISLSGVILPIVCTLFSLIFAVAHVSLSFEMAVKFGCTRRRALRLALSCVVTETALSFAVSAPLVLLEQKAMPWLWGLVRGVSGPLTTEVIALPLWVFPLLFVGGLATGILFGALIQRFGQRGSWVLFGVYMAALIVPQCLPDDLFDHSPAMLFPFLGMIAAALLLVGFGWALWSLLHSSVRA